jgi:outer membrane immunogenic protein
VKKICIQITALSALIAGPAFAADMAVKAPPQQAPVSNWTGWYVGIDAGYGLNEKTGDRFCINPAGALFGTGCSPNQYSSVTSPSGGLIGGEAGYNWQTGVVVMGVETDLQWSGIKSSATVPFPVIFAPGTSGLYTATDNLQWFGTTRGRIGFLPTPDLLVFATGGVIYGRESASAVTAPGAGVTYPAALSTTRTGAVGGLGIEYRLQGNLSAKLEGLYYDMGTLTASFNCPAGAATCTPGFTQGGTFKLDGAIVRAGLNWHFNETPPAAMVTK